MFLKHLKGYIGQFAQIPNAQSIFIRGIKNTFQFVVDFATWRMLLGDQRQIESKNSV